MDSDSSNSSGFLSLFFFCVRKMWTGFYDFSFGYNSDGKASDLGTMTGTKLSNGTTEMTSYNNSSLGQQNPCYSTDPYKLGKTCTLPTSIKLIPIKSSIKSTDQNHNYDSNPSDSITVNGTVVSGTGTVYIEKPIEQDKLYFEVEAFRGGRIVVGVGNKGDLGGSGGMGAPPSVYYVEIDAQKGDILSLTYDQANYPTFSVYVNGIFYRDCTGMKGAIHPYISLPAYGEVGWRFGDVLKKSSNPSFESFDVFMDARSVI